MEQFLDYLRLHKGIIVQPEILSAILSDLGYESLSEIQDVDVPGIVDRIIGTGKYQELSKQEHLQEISSRQAMGKAAAILEHHAQIPDQTRQYVYEGMLARQEYLKVNPQHLPFLYQLQNKLANDAILDKQLMVWVFSVISVVGMAIAISFIFVGKENELNEQARTNKDLRQKLERTSRGIPANDSFTDWLSRQAPPPR